MGNNISDLLNGFRFYGVRLSAECPTVGATLPNSWHNANDCDWVEQDTELDGTCCFEIQGEDAKYAARVARSYWPEERFMALIGSDEQGRGELPEDGAILLRRPVVLAVIER